MGAGQSYFRDAGVEHDVINIGNATFIEIEIKRHASSPATRRTTASSLRRAARAVEMPAWTITGSSGIRSSTPLIRRGR